MRGIYLILSALFLLPSIKVAEAQPQTPAISAPGGAYSVQLSPVGGLVVSVNGERYFVDSSFSYPYMPQDAWNNLGVMSSKSTGEWHWSASHNGTSFNIMAIDPHYRLDRNIVLWNDRIVVKDTFTNTSHDDLAIVFTNSLVSGQALAKTYVAGVAGKSRLLNNESSPSANPTIFMSSIKSGLGMVALDDYYKLQLELWGRGNVGMFKNVNFGLKPSASYTFQWAIYPQHTTDYYTFINMVRTDYVNPTTILGGLAFMPYNYPLTHSSQDVAKWLSDRAAKIVILIGPNSGAPWIDGYARYLANMKQPFNEANYIASLKHAVATLRSIDPTIKCLAPFETALTPDVQAGVITPKFIDSVAVGPDGDPAGYHFPHIKLAREIYVRANPHAFIYYPTLTNGYYRFVRGALQGVLNEAGVDGVYFDLFNYASPDFRWTYDRWDGHSVDVNLSNYTIARKKSDLAILSEAARAALVKMVLDAKPGNVVVANGPGMVNDIRALPIMHLIESDMDYGYAQTALSTPIVLGWTTGYKAGAMRDQKSGTWWRQWNTDADFFADIREKIASGNLYYTYWAPPGQMEMSNLTHSTILSRMYPITVMRLAPGLIVGRERIIALHSGIYSWGDMSTAKAYFYDEDGREVKGKFSTVLSSPRVNSFHLDVPVNGAAVLVREISTN
jgi:hypothetical protein